MALIEQSVISKIEILEDGQIQVRRSDRVLKDGVMIAEQYHRHVLEPGANLAMEHSRVKRIAQACWTPDVVQAFMTAKAAREMKPPS